MRSAAASLPLWWPFLSHGFVGVGVGAFAPLAGRCGTLGVLGLLGPLDVDVVVGFGLGVVVGFVVCVGDGCDTGTTTATGGTAFVGAVFVVECDEVCGAAGRLVDWAVVTEGATGGVTDGVTGGVAEALAGAVVDGAGAGEALLRGTTTTGVPPGFGVTANREFAPAA